MNENPIPLHDNKSFLIRLKEVDMSDEDYEKEKLDNNHRLVKDTRGRIFELAWLRGEYLRSENGNKEYPIVARVQERQDGNFDILNTVSKRAESPAETEGTQEEGQIPQKNRK